MPYLLHYGLEIARDEYIRHANIGWCLSKNRREQPQTILDSYCPVLARVLLSQFNQNLHLELLNLELLHKGCIGRKNIFFNASNILNGS